MTARVPKISAAKLRVLHAPAKAAYPAISKKGLLQRSNNAK
jgi:hypothetical protein